jgi:diguanylate cyclase (GGDEF)-like protein/PAS domain S-box-containing protein
VSTPSRASKRDSQSRDPGQPTPSAEVVLLPVHGQNASGETARVTEPQTPAEQELREAHERYRNLVEQLPLVVYVDEMAPNVPNVYTSPQTTEMLGYTPEDWRDIPDLFEQILHPDDRDRVLAEVDAELYRSGDSRMEYRLIARDGRTVWVRDEARAIGGSDGVPRRWQGYLLDITAQKEAQAELERLAYSDPLTGLGNRALLEQRIASCDGCGQLALLYLDLDDFKTVNDSLGHVVGDDLLVALAGRLREIVRASDAVVRIGGDEFAVLVPAGDAVAVAERIVAAFEQPFRIADHELFVAASIGIAVGADAGQILRDADLAMYDAKRGGSAFRFFEPAMRDAVVKRLELLRDLSRDSLFDELYLDYQPVFRLDTGELIAVEALLRWQHRERGLVPPLDFIGLAEETGRILDIGRWVLQTACAQAGHWQRRRRSGVTISVNVSVRQLRDPGFAADVERALGAGALTPSRLVLELTESALMTGDAVSTRNLEELRRLGVRIAIDDFGTGYSSLSYLERLAIDGIKIDRSFVEECDRSPEGLRLIDAIARLAQTLGLWIVAEGIERGAQLEPLRSTGCDAAQGFLLSRPLAAADVERLLPA